MSWYDNKELLSGADVIGWNSLLKNKKKNLTYYEIQCGIINSKIKVY